jgi:hypothetical protein
VVTRQLGRAPSRTEITAARRAANRLAQAGQAQVQRVPVRAALATVRTL